MRNNWKQGHPPPWSFTPSFSSPLSDLLFSLSLETGFLRTCIFSHTAPNRFIFFHVLPSARGHADSLTVLLKRKKTRKGFIGTSPAFPLSYFLSEFCKCNIYFRLSLNRPRTCCVVDNTQRLFSHSDKSQHGKQCDSPNITPVLPCYQMCSCCVAPRIWPTEHKSLGPQEPLPLTFLLT